MNGIRLQRTTAALRRLRSGVEARVDPGRISAAVFTAFVVFLTAGVAFVKLAAEVMEGEDAADGRIARAVIAHRSPWATTLFRTITRLADPAVVVAVAAVAAVLLVAWRRWSQLALLLLSSIGASLLTGALKALVGRDRPAVPDRLVFANGKAFPSGHSSQSVALYGALAIIVAGFAAHRVWKTAWYTLAGLVALSVGASRVYLGAHWSSDVVSGWALGTGWLAASWLAVRWSWVRRAGQSVPATRRH